jgi:hypothetical protein
MKVTSYLADFDSATAMLRALALFLDGKDFPMLGTQPISFLPYTLVNQFPRWLQEQIYIFGGWIEAIRPGQIDEINAREIARWVKEQYPRREYPMIALGSSNGAATHLFAALGIPWLPQTFLVPIRHGGRLDADDPRRAMEAFVPLGRALLRRNPEFQLHHMHDANQDRLMIQVMGYFRLKFRHLPPAYKEFLVNNLAPGGTVLLLECGLKWPVTTVSEHYFFQNGALGGLAPEEYAHGSPTVEHLLRSHGSQRKKWDSPPADRNAPEAEWGFEPALGEEVEALARQRGWKVIRVVFEKPEQMSPLVADFYRWWYARRGLPANRLLVSSFVVMEPWWTVRTGSVPFWMVFNKRPSAESLRTYLHTRPTFDDVYLMLFSHGVESARLVTIAEWKELLGLARRRGEFLGVDPDVYPRDFAAFVRYHRAAKRIAARYPMPGPLAWSELQEFLKSSTHDYQVHVTDETAVPVTRPEDARPRIA